MHNPFAGVKPFNPYHWPYLIGLLISPFVLLFCIATLFAGGIILAVVFWIVMFELEPAEVTARREGLPVEQLFDGTR
jgi:hypothetical protein